MAGKLPLAISNGEVEQLQAADVLINQQGTVVYAVAAFATDTVILRSDGTGFGSQLSALSITDAAQLVWTGFSNILIGTNTGNSIVFGVRNTFIGNNAGQNVTSGDENAFIGVGSGQLVNTGKRNTGVSPFTLPLLTTGDRNVAIGYNAGEALTTGDNNVFIGETSGSIGGGQLVTAVNTIAIGSGVATTASNQVIIGNTSITETNFRGLIQLTGVKDGTVSLLSPIVSILDSVGSPAFEIRVDLATSNNTIIGVGAGPSITSGSGLSNTLVGSRAGAVITTGDGNVGLGFQTLFGLTIGSQNMAIGSFALAAIVGVSGGVAVGYAALTDATGADNTGLGWSAGRAITTGVQNVFIGSGAGFTGQLAGVNNTIGIGFGVVTTADNQMILGNTSITDTKIRGVVELKQTTLLETSTAHLPILVILDSTGVTTFEIIAHTLASGNMFLGSNGTGSAVTDGTQNTTLGKGAGAAITTGDDNVLIGFNAGNVITTGESNMCFGSSSGASITTGLSNVLAGTQAGGAITSGFRNTCFGNSTGALITTTFNNTCIGASSGNALAGTNPNAKNNTFLGAFSGSSLVTGSHNIFVGFFAGHTDQGAGVDFSIAIGDGAITTGDEGIAIGTLVSAAANQIVLGNVNHTETILRGVVEGDDGTFVSNPTAFATDNAIVRADTVSGADTVQTSSLVVSDLGQIIFPDTNIKIGVAGTGDAITTGTDNTLLGDRAGTDITEGNGNVCLGDRAGQNITTGSFNFLLGNFSGGDIVTAGGNVGVGIQSLAATTNADNVGIGGSAGSSNITGRRNIFIGADAGNTASQITSALNSMALGSQSFTTKSNQVVIGNSAIVETILRGDIILSDGGDVILGTTTGTIIAAAVGQKLGFWGATPIVQPAAANQAALVNSTGGSRDGTLAAIGDTTAVDQGPALNDNLTDIHELLNEIRTALVNAGIMKGVA